MNLIILTMMPGPAHYWLSGLLLHLLIRQWRISSVYHLFIFLICVKKMDLFGSFFRFIKDFVGCHLILRMAKIFWIPNPMMLYTIKAKTAERSRLCVLKTIGWKMPWKGLRIGSLKLLSRLTNGVGLAPKNWSRMYSAMTTWTNVKSMLINLGNIPVFFRFTCPLPFFTTIELVRLSITAIYVKG